MFAARRLATRFPRPSPFSFPAATISSPFHSTAAAFVQKGDPIPDLDVLTEGSPGNKVNLAKELDGGKGLIIGVPAAFSTLTFFFFFFFFFGPSAPANSYDYDRPCMLLYTHSGLQGTSQPEGCRPGIRGLCE